MPGTIEGETGRSCVLYNPAVRSLISRSSNDICMVTLMNIILGSLRHTNEIKGLVSTLKT